MEILWTEYIARNNPDGGNKVLASFGYQPIDNYEDLFTGLNLLQADQGDKATIELMKEHPDYDAIVGVYKSQEKKYTNAIGDENTTPVQPQQIIVTPSQQMPQQKEGFNSLLQNVVLAVMAFWIINKIISQ
jgi:hypothetical protein